MEDPLQTQNDLEKLLGRVFQPLSPDQLQRMLNAARQLMDIDARHPLYAEALSEAILPIEDIDYRDMFRSRAATRFAVLGRWDEALAIANQIEVLPEKLDNLLLLSSKLLKENKQTRAEAILSQVETAAFTGSLDQIWAWQKVRILDETAGIWIRAGNKQGAMEAWENAINIAREAASDHMDEDILIALQNMVGHLAPAGFLALAERAAELIWFSARREIANKIIAEAKEGDSASKP